MTATPTAAASERVDWGFYGWRVVAVAIVAGVLTGPGQTIGVSVFIDHFETDLDLTREAIAAAYLVGTLLGALALPPVGRRIDRVGVRPAMTAIACAFGVALVWMAGVQGLVTLAIGFTGIRMLGQGSLTLVSTVAVSVWFERRRGLAMGIFMTAVGAGMALVPVGLDGVIQAAGWRTAWLVAAVIVVAVIVPLARLVLVSRPSDLGLEPDGGAPPADGGVGPPTPGANVRSATRAEALRTPAFWLLATAMMAIGALTTGLNFHQIDILGQAGLDESEAARMFLPQIVGSLAVGFGVSVLTDRVAPRLLIVVNMALLAGALALVATADGRPQIVAYAIVLGAAGGTSRALSGTLMPKWFGIGHIGSIQGALTVCGVAASAVGPLLFTLSQSAAGGDYSPPLLALVVFPAAIALAALLVPTPANRGQV